MAVGILNRVGMTTATTGTGTVTLGPVISNKFLSAAEAGAANGKQYYWLLEDGNDFEIFVGAYSTSGPTVSRDTVLASKIGGVAGTTKLTLSGSGVSIRAVLPSDALALEALGALSASAKSTKATLLAGTADGEFVTPKAVQDASATYALGNISGTVALNFASGLNQSGTATGNITLGQHTGIIDQQPVTLEIVQDGTGTRTLAVNTTYNKFAGGTVPTLSTAAGARGILYGTARVIGGVGVVDWTGFAKEMKP